MNKFWLGLAAAVNFAAASLNIVLGQYAWLPLNLGCAVWMLVLLGRAE